MAFNSMALQTARERHGMSRESFGKMVGLSRSTVQKVETNVREPSLDTLRQISDVTGISADVLIRPDAESPPLVGNGAEKLRRLLPVVDDLSKAEYKLKRAEKQLAAVERDRNHLLVIVSLAEKLVNILMQKDTSRPEQGKKMASLARQAIGGGQVHFAELQAMFHQPRSTIEKWLKSAKTEYRCNLHEMTKEAHSPSEASLAFGCFDCEARDDGTCDGFGESMPTDDLFTLVAFLEADGITNREAQASFLRDHFFIEVTAHKLSDILSRHRLGKTVPEDLVNLHPAPQTP
jgi:transcriptional regulator with XRE-family HTH domain